MGLQQRRPYLLKLQARGALSELQQSRTQWDLPSLPPVDSCSKDTSGKLSMSLSAAPCMMSAVGPQISLI